MYSREVISHLALIKKNFDAIFPSALNITRKSADTLSAPPALLLKNAL